MLESNKDPYKNAVRLYKMYRRTKKFSNRVLDTPKLEGKPQDCTQTYVDVMLGVLQKSWQNVRGVRGAGRRT